MKTKHTMLQAKKEFVLYSNENPYNKLRLTEKTITIQYGQCLFVGALDDINSLISNTLENVDFKCLTTDIDIYSYNKLMNNLNNVSNDSDNKDFFDLLEIMLDNYSQSKETVTGKELHKFISVIQENTEVKLYLNTNELNTLLKNSVANTEDVLKASIKNFTPLLQEVVNDTLLFNDIKTALKA